LAFAAAGLRTGFCILSTSLIIDIAALATDARDVSGTASNAVRKACVTGRLPLGARLRLSSDMAMML
jgi:hypothetical protein